jgi:predicted nucleotidyltransferase
MINAPKALAVIERLMGEALIAKYAIGGAFGALFYLEPTETSDIDIFIHLDPPKGSFLISIDPFIDRLEDLGYTDWIEDKIVVEGCPIQFVPVAKPIEIEGLERAERKPLTDEIQPFVFSPEYLMAIALDLSRSKDKVRLEQFHRTGAYNPTALADVLKRHNLEEKWQRILKLFEDGPLQLPSNK